MSVDESEAVLDRGEKMDVDVQIKRMADFSEMVVIHISRFYGFGPWTETHPVGWWSCRKCDNGDQEHQETLILAMPGLTN